MIIDGASTDRGPGCLGKRNSEFSPAVTRIKAEEVARSVLFTVGEFFNERSDLTTARRVV